MTWLALPVLAAIGGAFWWFWRKGKAETTGKQQRGWTVRGSVPDGAVPFLEALGREVGIPGGIVSFTVDRIPAGYGPGACDAITLDPWMPVIACINGPSWRALLVHEVGHVLRLRKGQDGEPDPAWCEATLRKATEGP